MPLKAAAYTCGIFTIGNNLDEKLKTIEDENEIKLIQAACAVFMKTGINFIKDLIAKEAALESFELGDLAYFYRIAGMHSDEKKDESFEIPAENNSKELLLSTLKELQSEKIGVMLEESGEVKPRFTSAFVIGWFPKSKKKSSKSSPLKK